jgi:hypothetical protein
MLAGSLAERRLLSLVPESPVIVWRGSLAGNPVAARSVESMSRRSRSSVAWK